MGPPDDGRSAVPHGTLWPEQASGCSGSIGSPAVDAL